MNTQELYKLLKEKWPALQRIAVHQSPNYYMKNYLTIEFRFPAPVGTLQYSISGEMLFEEHKDYAIKHLTISIEDLIKEQLMKDYMSKQWVIPTGLYGSNQYYTFPNYLVQASNAQAVATPSVEGNVISELKKLLPNYTSLKKFKCPSPGCSGERDVFTEVMHLNDTHGWTREAIADWLESLDEKFEFKDAG